MADEVTQHGFPEITAEEAAPLLEYKQQMDEQRAALAVVNAEMEALTARSSAVRDLLVHAESGLRIVTRALAASHGVPSDARLAIDSDTGTAHWLEAAPRNRPGR